MCLVLNERKINRDSEIEEWERQEEKQRKLKILKNSGIGIENTFKSFVCATSTEKNVAGYCKFFAAQVINDLNNKSLEKESHILVLCGDPGVGKTHLAKACAVQILFSANIDVGFGLKAYPSIGYIRSVSLCKEFNTSNFYTKEDLHGKMSEKYGSRHFLIVDEVFALKSFVRNDVEAGILFEILNVMMERGKNLVLITNRSFDEFCELMGKAGASRLKGRQSTVVDFNGIADKRQQECER